MVRINRAEPRIQMTLDACGAIPIGIANLYMRRVGDEQDFAIYAPIEISGTTYVFQFDELLFSKLQGRYKGRLLIGVVEAATIYLEYRDTLKVVDLENISV